MKNLKSFPFERNRYFYGKLLSVEDFETEHKYFNDKRRTINRFLFGSGVVCGLGVVEVDDESISVERGLALDFAGREIVLDEPAVRRISELEGYGEEQEGDFYYLCLEYQEETAELMHNVTGTMGRNSSEYNKYKEGYRLFVTQEEPERETFSPARLYEERQTVYQEQGIKISQVLPSFLEMGKDTVLRIEVEHTGQQELSFEYELELSFLTNGEGNRVHVSFQEENQEKAGKYQIEIPMKAACVNDVQAEAALVGDSFKLKLGGREYSEAAPCVSRARISDQNIYDCLQTEYYKTAMDYIVGNTFQQGIYLAKIYVVRAGDVCLIERIEPLPFEQKIMHTEISAAMIGRLTEDVKRLKEAELLETENRKEQEEKKPLKTAYGDVVFDVSHMRPGKVLYSDEIVHGLGFGPVTIDLGYEVDNGFSGDSQMVFGDASLFQDKYGFAASLGARLEPSRGTFEIALKIIKNSSAKLIRVHWTALRNEVRKSESARKKRIYIQPDNPNVFTGDSIAFTAVLEGFTDERLQWSVRDRNGGTIDKNGKYTAPETASIFQISVSSTAYPQVQASTFIVVREKE
ncbi:hypothetical protein E5329_08740 [Petralouisia muris]|uniref:Uncharacterized protein n=1 Tax=Petralouisia muris TaxID=3032872 RepID=A0AC61RXK0_9FIRM|nr:hypothetical protein [Petralouisia muris]TGY96638.1 hypothetical protein E5329_08740 [Petralouisia muris]